MGGRYRKTDPGNLLAAQPSLLGKASCHERPPSLKKDWRQARND
ncbi:sarcolipin, partial [Rattus norvegicus]